MAREDGMQPSLLERMRHWAAHTPDAACLSFEDVLMTFADLDECSDRLANVLVERGVGPGDRVALLSHTATIFYELAYACAKIGAIMMPLNWRLACPEIAAIIADGDPVLVLYQRSLAASLVGAGSFDRVTLDELTDLRDATSPELDVVPRDPDEPTLLLYTSGTTGQPKGVVITHRNLSYVEPMARQAWGFTASSVNLVAMPLFHIGGIGYGMMALSQGGHTVLLQHLDPASVADAIERHWVSHAFFVPTVIQRLVDHVEAGGAKPRGLKRIIYGAAPIGEPLLRRAIALFGCEFSHAYGATETAGTVISLPPEEHDPDGPTPERLRSCGRPLPWVEMRLVDPATNVEVAPAEVGEICIRSGMVMQGYWRKPAETAAAIDADGWLHTGDAAYCDVDGFVFIHDRYKDMIVSGAENIYPTEIENVMGAHPHVGQVAVIGVAHSKWGETPRAYVVPRGAAPDAAALIAWTRERLAHYKCPTSVVFVDALPQTASGKVLKKQLRELDRVREEA